MKKQENQQKPKVKSLSLMNQPLRIIFAGTPEFAGKHLECLINMIKQSHHELVAVYTQPDRPSGRGRKLQPSPVKILAEANSIPVYQPESLKTFEVQDQLEKLKPDLMIVVAYGLILPQFVLDIPVHGCINVHGSLLPKWRGAAPIQHSLMSGDKKTGITIMQMDKGLDTGDMLLKSSIPVTEDDTSATLYEKLASLGRKSLPLVINQIAENKLNRVKQDESLASYAHKITKEEGKIDWRLPSFQVSCHIRALNPWPVAWTTLKDEIIRLWEVSVVDIDTSEAPGTIIKADKKRIIIACGQQAIVVNRLQLAGKRAMSTQDVLNSRREFFAPGSRFQ